MSRVGTGQMSLLGFGAALLAAAAFTGSGASTVAEPSGIPPDEDYGAGAAGCPVTETGVSDLPGPAGAALGIAQNGLWVSFGEKSTAAVPPAGYPTALPGTTLASMRPNGAIAAKIPWWRDRRAWGRLRVSGRHWPGGERLRARYTNHLGPQSKVVPGGMVFPVEGCWQVRGRSGSAKLVAVIWVVNVP